MSAPRSAMVPVEQSAEMLEELDDLPGSTRRSYLGRRLREALEFLDRTGDADGLEEELKYLSELDEVRQHDSYGLVRIVIWATPMLGFLGTVVGITRALGDLDPKLLATNIEQAMQGLLAGLYVAFDTTSLALSLSMVLMFVQFFAERVETAAPVDRGRPCPRRADRGVSSRRAHRVTRRWRRFSVWCGK